MLGRRGALSAYHLRQGGPAQAIERAPLAHALAAACAQFGRASTVALDLLPRLRKRDGQPVCLFDVCGGAVTLCATLAQAPQAEAAALLRSMLGDSYPVRKLLVPDGMAGWASRLILESRPVRLLGERRQRLFHAPAGRSVCRPVAGAPRPARASDLDRLTALAALEAWQGWSDSRDAEGWTRGQAAYLRRAVAEERCFVWEDGSPVSCAMVGPSSRESFEMVDVCTLPEARRQGFASALLIHVARLMAPAAPIVFVEQGNAPAEALYRRLGFVSGGWWRCMLFDPLG